MIVNVKVEEIKGSTMVGSILYEDQNNKEKKELPVEGVFVAIGSVPESGFLKNLVDFNQQGEIKINPFTCETKTPGIFAAGDVSEVKYKQVVVAAGEGAKAALSAYEYIKNRYAF